MALDQLEPERGFDRLERVTGLGAVGAAGLRHVGPAAATLAAQRRLSAFFDQVDGIEAASQGLP